MPISRIASLVLAALATAAATTAAQQSSQSDSARAQIRQTLRAFYFNLAHHDWEAMTADILAAKVVAHRPPPSDLVNAPRAGGSASARADRLVCAPGQTGLVESATITLEGDWAEVTVPRCDLGLIGGDEFRLIHFEQRWRFVYIDLLEQPVSVSAER